MKNDLTTILGTRAFNDICCLRMPNEDLARIIEAAVEQLYLNGGPDIRLAVRKPLEELLSKPKQQKKDDPVNDHGRWWKMVP